jgi:ribose transport system permease protein
MDAPPVERRRSLPARVVQGGRGRVGALDLAQRLALPAVWGIVVLVFGILRPTTFLSIANFSTIFGSQTTIVVLTLGLLVPLTAGDYDLSVAYNLSLSSMIVALLNVNAHWPIGVAIVAALLVGAFVGAVNGALVILFGIDPFIVTLGTGTFIQGVVFWISDSNTISGVSAGLIDWVGTKTLLGIPLEFYYGLVLAAIVWYVFEFTPIGRRLLIVGRGRDVARLSGLHVARIRWGALIASGVVGALAGVMYTGTTGAADPTSGSQLLLPAFAAAFLGATTIMPGRFNPWGSTIAVYFLVTGITGLQILGVQAFVQQLFYGGVLVVAVALSQLARRRQALDTGTTG